MRKSRTEQGALIARVLSGAWRAVPPPLDFSEAELNHTLPLLLRTGAAGLAWWRVRHSPLANTESGGELQQAYRHYTLRAATREPAIAATVSLLERHGMRPLLMKGWAAARFYPAKGLRPYGDVDLYVPREALARANELLLERSGPACAVELHAWPERLL
ncbi:MAG TPA: nucleotidyltransferase family protein, partial [Armatimonadota bacterium]|nr:nucleotidyltransferase family protein [Armatimonadota bacterium]